MSERGRERERANSRKVTVNVNRSEERERSSVLYVQRDSDVECSSQCVR